MASTLAGYRKAGSYRLPLSRARESEMRQPPIGRESAKPVRHESVGPS
jgi:hypothetical protein